MTAYTHPYRFVWTFMHETLSQLAVKGMLQKHIGREFQDFFLLTTLLKNVLREKLK